MKFITWSKDKARMLQWLIVAIILYAAALPIDQPQIQTALWKCGNVTLAAWLGYMIDRHAFYYERCDKYNHMCQIRRAIIMAATMLAIGLGL